MMSAYAHMLGVLAVGATVVLAALGPRLLLAPWAKAVTLAALVAVLLAAPSKATWLPFLGPAAFPASLLAAGAAPEGATLSLRVPAPPGTRAVAYWAAGDAGAGGAATPWLAYADFSNAGVALPGADGRATLRLRCPGTYAVPGRPGRLPRHVHYRTLDARGMASEVHTARVAC